MKQEKTFLGQPLGLSTLFSTELWERFSYYGMKAILIYYMYYSVAKGGLGFDKTVALSIMSIYGSMVYLSTVLGGFIADRILGSRKTVFYGGVFIMFGHIFLSLPFGKLALFASIISICIGTGMLKPNISDMVGKLYPDGDNRKDAGFNIFVFGINFGALIAPLIVGTIGLNYNFHVGFSIAAIGMFIALLNYYLVGNKRLGDIGNEPSAPLTDVEKSKIKRNILLGTILFILVLGFMKIIGILNIENFISLLSIIVILTPIAYFMIMLNSKKVNSIERKKVLAYIPLFIAATVFWAIEEQGSVVLALFAADQTNNSILGFNINVSWYQLLNPGFIMLYTPLFAYMWTKLGKKQPSTPKKFAYGMFFAGLSYIFMMIPIGLFGETAKVSPFWLIGSWAIIEIAELLISPIGLSVTTSLAPKSFESQMLGMWFLADAAGQAINSQIVKFYVPGNEMNYFMWIGIVSIVAGIVLLFMLKKIKNNMGNVL
ncbi:MFS transporter [Lactobacillus sp. S2-2]|uniref:peptide MFS transporter n=1 Tax=Lactobacillus sp. S2-2 TaxID=2692917 RepID=UPI001F40C23B|nr:peptide MFS transporter [Lactobacillus sp. S2-2]MCF6515621.1 MFS transporter [Lactobacillus sp. S2-2]